MTHRPDESKFYTDDKSKADYLESEMRRLENPTAEAMTYTEWTRRNPVSDTPAPEAWLFEHEDGRHAVGVGSGSPDFTHGDPKWHRVGPVDVSRVVQQQLHAGTGLLSEAPHPDSFTVVTFEPTEAMEKAFDAICPVGEDFGDAWAAACATSPKPELHALSAWMRKYEQERME